MLIYPCPNTEYCFPLHSKSVKKIASETEFALLRKKLLYQELGFSYNRIITIFNEEYELYVAKV